MTLSASRALWPAPFVDQRGNRRPGLTITVYEVGTGPAPDGDGSLVLAELFTDDALTVPGPNPITTDADGNETSIKAAAGEYDAYVAGETIRFLVVDPSAAGDAAAVAADLAALEAALPDTYAPIAEVTTRAAADAAEAATARAAEAAALAAGTAKYLVGRTQPAVSGVTPSDLTMYGSAVQGRLRYPFGDDGRFVIHEEKFAQVTPDGFFSWSAADSQFVQSKGRLTITPTAQVYPLMRSTSIPVAPYVYVRTRIEAATGAPLVVPGMYKDINNYVGVDYNASTKVIKADVVIASSLTQTTMDSTTLPAPPFDLIAVVAWPSMVCFIDRGYGYEPTGIQVNITALDLRTDANQLLYSPGVLCSVNNGQSVTLSNYKAGYVGDIGYRESKLATYLDGTPLMHKGKYVLTTTILATGDWMSQHCAVTLFDPDTLTLELASHIFFKTPGLHTSLSSGQLIYDDVNDEFIFLMSEFGKQSPNVAKCFLWVGRTDRNVFEGVHLVEASSLVFADSNIHTMYDPCARFDGTNWQVVAANTTTDVSTGFYHPILLRGPTLDNTLVRIAEDATGTRQEGLQWLKVGGSWYIASGGTTPGTWLTWDANLANKTDMTTPWKSNLNGLQMDFVLFGQHPCIIPIAGRTTTRYALVTWVSPKMPYDTGTGAAGSRIGGTSGAPCAFLSSQTPTGFEFAKRRLRRGD